MNPVLKAKLKKEEMKEDKMSPMGYAKREKAEPMKKEAMEQMAEMKTKKAMKPSMQRAGMPKRKMMRRRIMA